MGFVHRPLADLDGKMGLTLPEFLELTILNAVTRGARGMILYMLEVYRQGDIMVETEDVIERKTKELVMHKKSQRDGS
jgi:hypothetical protein